MISLHEKPTTFNYPRATPTEPGRCIAVVNLRRGEGTTVATCDLKVGGILIRGVRVRRGRNGSAFVNLPSFFEDDEWKAHVEITSPSLEAVCHQVVLEAVGEVTRW